MATVEVIQLILDRFKKVGTPTVYTILMNMGYESVFMEGVHPINDRYPLTSARR